MTRLVTGLLALALFLLTITGMKNADVLARQSTSISLRWRQALDATTVSAAREKQPGLTLWGQTEEPLTTGWRQVQATLITYQGDPALVWDPACLSGALPAPLDASGCAVSAALAWALFGSEDAVGLTLTWGDAVYTVRGIFDSEDCLALPVALAAWPAWLTPSRWSDFAWWGRLAGQLRGQFLAWLAAPCLGRDLGFKAGLLAQGGRAVLQCVLCEVLRCRLRRQRKRPGGL